MNDHRIGAIAGAGNDTNSLGTGNNIVDAGSGDDVIIAIFDGLDRIDGGAGRDTVRTTSTSLSDADFAPLRGVEAISFGQGTAIRLDANARTSASTP